MAGRQIFAALEILRILFCGGVAAWQQLWKISSTAMLFFLVFTMVAKKKAAVCHPLMPSVDVSLHFLSTWKYFSSPSGHLLVKSKYTFFLSFVCPFHFAPNIQIYQVTLNTQMMETQPEIHDSSQGCGFGILWPFQEERHPILNQFKDHELNWTYLPHNYIQT